MSAYEAPNRSDVAVWTLKLPDEVATGRIAQYLAPLLGPGDMITLTGGLGAGKTAFARCLIRALAHDETLEVPSPTFTLVQTYDVPATTSQAAQLQNKTSTSRAPMLAVQHLDLFRLQGPEDLQALDFEESVDHALTLIEWPERAASVLPPDRLDIMLRLLLGTKTQERLLTLSGYGLWRERLRRAQDIYRLLHAAGWAQARREYLQGDASSRAYERLFKPDGQSAILMISPPRPDGPPIRRGKSYSAIAKLAENVEAFVALARGLRQNGLSAPDILFADLDAGLLLIEDFGLESVLINGAPDAERYLASIDALAHLHTKNVSNTLPVTHERHHIVPPYDLEAFLIEAELILDWYMPHIAGSLISAASRAEFLNLWTNALEPVLHAPTTWVLRDYHSPNIMWVEGRSGVRRVGILDFQDAVMGHAAYDVVSLAQDARVNVPLDLELKLLTRYGALRRASDPDFDVGGFARAYALLGAQRATKILGIFARLDKRDRKPQYLKHLPRVESYLKRNLDHPALAPLKTWYMTQIPSLFAVKQPKA
jgi:aminoglycoside/choline kinase family phosphotransferase/tRNA A37 threonylcarbamoyladenosine biosynthesis protein TsaE